ncbi:hypothetical protein BO83DRAFT_232309 [Aspergillus eucalypticola CBS 122712]|uniref:Uncharacterized protein n=1 Tax=Aspergillus eucalypticola (strain CBS 122712 / IBT 29274) TaxID=1448314 RepID=A0A317VT97_ASPEC|nr:uncharacterized protein BO83DRAFT_232309 [Aspergillus eucalypticola CBS 122712]PWY76541.1 hypothetical protein BO83DRAFT_232309 [Aspergillus eucalypticola CBS 122712]
MTTRSTTSSTPSPSPSPTSHPTTTPRTKTSGTTNWPLTLRTIKNLYTSHHYRQCIAHAAEHLSLTEQPVQSRLFILSYLHSTFLSCLREYILL